MTPDAPCAPGISHLSVLTQLTRLDLCSPRVTGTAMLQACRPLTRIQFLDFGSCYHDSVEFQQMLLTFPRLKDLDYVDPRCNALNLLDVVNLCVALPH